MKDALDWKRIWVKLRPDDQRGAAPNNEIALSSLRNAPCLVLLGNPGLGKSNEIHREAAALIDQGATVTVFALGRYSTVNELRSELFEASRVIPTAPWYIFFDGLDEALAEIGQSSASIPSIFRELSSLRDLESIRFRITCRSAEWPRSLEEALQSLWGAPEVAVLELQPLSHDDIELAALNGTADSRSFLKQIENREVEALAQRPVTLNMLIDVFSRNGLLPVRRVQLYREALLIAIEQSMRQEGQSKRPAAQSQLIVAGRIAAASIFSNSTQIGISSSVDASRGRTVGLSEIVGGYEPGFDGSFYVTNVELYNALKTPIFTQLASDTFVFSHHTFAEFLAAYYLIERKLDNQNILELLRSSDSSRIPPQLREIAAWLASMDRGIFDALAASDPDILLRSDAASASPDARATLVRELLSRFDRAQLHDFDHYARNRYSQLGHPGLIDQLRPYILDKTKNIVVRRAAIDIAEANGVSDLSNDLANVALDRAEDLHIRTQAAAALSKIGESPYRARLRELIAGDPLDVNDELKGYALEALWPNDLSVEALINSLTPEKNQSWIGSYSFFVSRFEVPALTVPQALTVLNWVASIGDDDDDEGRIFSRAIPKLLDRVWELSNDPAIMDALAEFVSTAVASSRYHLLRNFTRSLWEAVASDHERRLILIEKIVSLGRTDNVVWMIFGLPSQLLSAGDLPWLLSKLQRASTEVRSKFVQLILGVVPRDNLDDALDVWLAAENTPELALGLEKLFSCELSDASAWQRDEYQRKKEREEKAAKQRFDALSALENRLRQVESENSFGWWELNLAFLANERGMLGDEFKSDLTATDLWAAIPEMLKLRVIKTAYQYLEKNCLRSTSWIGSNTFHRPAAAAYRAFRLLFENDRSGFDNLATAVWENWCPCLFVSFNERSDEVTSAIFERAMLFAPERLLRSFARIVLKNRSEYDARRAVQLDDKGLSSKWSDFTWRLVGKLDAGKVREALLAHLASIEYPPLTMLLMRDLSSSEAVVGREYSENEFVIAVAKLLQANPAIVWPAFVRFREKQTELAVRIIRSFDYDAPFISNMSEADLADFYVWTYKEIPPPKEHTGARYLTTDDDVDLLRNSIINRLKSLGTPAAVAAVKRISSTLQNIPWLQYAILDARRALDATTWRLKEPSQVIATIALYSPIDAPVGTKAKLAEIDNLVGRGFGRAERLLTSEESSLAETVLQSTSLIPIKVRQVLAVATEWFSGHGGISTLNRELCMALAKLGHGVACLVLRATNEERLHARQANVQLVTPFEDAMQDLDDITKLLLFPRDGLGDFKPEIVIGHDHITGSAARHIARSYYGVPYVHFVHTLPEESERYKTRGSKNVLKGALKSKVQIEQCKSADLVVAIGPKILQQISGPLSSANVKVVELWPGLDVGLMKHTVDPSRKGEVICLLMARFEDPEIKGAPLACRVIAKINSNWTGGPWTRPSLILRGFTLEKADEEVSAIDGYNEAKDYVKCRPFTSETKEVAEEICGSSVVLMPSTAEGFGLAALEAIAAGIPTVISSETGLGQLLLAGGVPAHVSDTVRPWVADVKGPDRAAIVDDWAHRIRTILSNPSAAFAQAEKLRDQLSAILSWESASRKFSHDIEELLRTRDE